ncbi:histidine kinase/DNA gyrase B/HSP90-like ATPase [Pseudoduganella flava]|uniref:Histidine kinase n=1 Tax=Pseudoduganella flava TaxID=871742 RepID=A0A562Q085_9BURK|nr:CHASE3 domain-containing protein [Pseudoduganella flava]QGZ38393.1 histidine kinase [Pseudoduganella flava]TWI50064.1 histidine kinase/DNA gyrase B/HSP90-like ATPase [Pseudoduganella flava]
MYFTVKAAPQHRLPLYKTVLCVTCALILIVNGLFLFHNLEALKRANAQVLQSSRVAERLQYLDVLVQDAESSMRGYFISGNEVYLGPTRTVSAETEAEFRQLEKLLADNPAQLKNLSQLNVLVRRKLAMLGQTVDVYNHGGLDEIVNISRYADERNGMDEIRLQTVIMIQEQNETLAARSARFYDEYHKALVLGMGINGVAILVLVMFYQLVRRSFVNQAAVEHKLQQSNENLEEMVAQRTEQLSVLSRHLISISEEEKVRLSRELHDEMGANLTSIGMDIGAVMQQLKETHPELAAQLKRARGTLVDTVELKRRIVENLRPSLLDNLGLCAAIDSYTEDFARMTKLPCETEIGPEVDAIAREGDASLSIALFRIVQESLTNIRKYAQASRVSVTLKRTHEGLVLRIIDDGIGIAANTLAKPMSHGILGMRERALLLGGSLTIRRGRNDKGTCIEVRIPLKDAAVQAAPQPLSIPLRQRADDHIPSSPPYSTHPHSVPDPHDLAQ